MTKLKLFCLLPGIKPAYTLHLFLPLFFHIDQLSHSIEFLSQQLSFHLGCAYLHNEETLHPGMNITLVVYITLKESIGASGPTEQLIRHHLKVT